MEKSYLPIYKYFLFLLLVGLFFQHFCSAQEECTDLEDTVAKKSRKQVRLLKEIKAELLQERLCSAPCHEYNQTKFPRDCYDVRRALGENNDEDYVVTRIYPYMLDSPIEVSCDMYKDGGGWTVFQRRRDGTVDFDRDWEEYRDGFGNIDGEHWLGNKIIHEMTTYSAQELRVDTEDWQGNNKVAKYHIFHVGSEAENFKLNVSRYYGTALDELKYCNGLEFSTIDIDNDEDETRHLAELYSTGGWMKVYIYRGEIAYRYCQFNGVYVHGEEGTNVTGFRWYDKTRESLRFMEMKIRPLLYGGNP